MRRRPRLFEAALFGATALALTFLLLPLVAIFIRVPLGELVTQLWSDVAVDALLVTLETNAIAQALILIVGTPTAYFIASRRFRGRALAITLIELPLVLPPAVAGLALLAAFGRLGLLGSTFEVLGVTVSTGTKAAVVLAVAYVASPFYIRGAIASFEALDQPLLDASRTLGAGPARTFFRIALPLAIPGLVVAFLFAFVFAWNEFLFGLTLTFDHAKTLPVQLAGNVTLRGPRYWDIAAQGLVVMLPPLFIALFLGRYIVRGLTLGALK